MFIARDLTPLSHNCLILESKEMQGLSELWGNAVSQQNRSGCMRRTWSEFKANEVWTLKKNIAEETEVDWGSWMQVSDSENKWASWNREKEERNVCKNKEVKPEKVTLKEGVNLCRRGADELQFGRRYSIPWTLPSPSVWSCLYRVWYLSHGCRKQPAPWVFRRQRDPFNKPWHCPPPVLSSSKVPSGFAVSLTLAFDKAERLIMQGPTRRPNPAS